MPFLKVWPWMDPRTFWVGGADPPIDNSNTATVIIKLVRVKDDREGKRAWEIEITYNGQKIHDEPQLELFDRFLAQDYDNYFKFFADDSIDPSQRSPELKNQIWTAEKKIKKYGDDLLCQLKLDSEHPERRHKNLNMLIVEEHEINDNDQKSLHNIVWELLEHPQCWKNRRINRVNVTRILCPRTRPLHSNSNTGLRDDDKPVRILLITGRSLEKKHSNKTNWKYTEKVRPSLIQHPLMQVMQHLDDIGCKRKIQLDILRPATFGELTSYLGVGQNDPAVVQNFDIIHVDLHGEMRRPVPRSGDHGSEVVKQPHLVFTQTTLGQPYVLATKLADALRDRTKLLVMNACNSSSLKGELGIQMVRAFLNEHIDRISATSYRLEAIPASIYYPIFYMSLLLHESFHIAAAEGRQALRRDTRRHGGQKRDDHYVHWNWSIRTKIQLGKKPPRSPRLHCLMLLECIPRLLSYLFAFLFFKTQDWRRNQTDHYPMYAVHRNFERIESHVRRAKQLPIPGITLHALDIEFQLKSHRKYSIYLHPPHKNSLTELESIRHLVVQNMVRNWVETNFIVEAQVLRVDKMLEQALNGGPETRYKSPFRRKPTYEDLLERAEWYWRQPDGIEGRKQLEVKSMLIVDGIHHLVSLEEDQHFEVLKRIRAVTEEMKTRNGDKFFVITIGGLLEEEWKNKLHSEFSKGAIGSKWASPAVMMIPLDH